ncbi:MAG: S-layer homology domain-containing protein [Clostridia bacterium]
MKAPVPLFDDVDVGVFYEKAIEWALDNEVTNGLTETTFGPDANGLRYEIVNYLFCNATI